MIQRPDTRILQSVWVLFDTDLLEVKRAAELVPVMKVLAQATGNYGVSTCTAPGKHWEEL
eukprot:3611458-Amphidinium_carterae.1